MRRSSVRHSGLTKLPSATATLLLAPGRQELAHMELSTLVGQHDRCLKPQQILSAFFGVQFSGKPPTNAAIELPSKRTAGKRRCPQRNTPIRH